MTRYHQIPGRETVRDLLKKEPAVIIGILVGILLAIVDAVAQASNGGSIDWHTAVALAIPAIVGVLVRFGVWSPASVEAAVQAAQSVGKVVNVTVAGTDPVAVAKAVEDKIQ